jgi:hypothetical protein
VTKNVDLHFTISSKAYHAPKRRVSPYVSMLSFFFSGCDTLPLFYGFKSIEKGDVMMFPFE